MAQLLQSELAQLQADISKRLNELRDRYCNTPEGIQVVAATNGLAVGFSVNLDSLKNQD
jgi:hypothetical protein